MSVFSVAFEDYSFLIEEKDNSYLASLITSENTKCWETPLAEFKTPGETYSVLFITKFYIVLGNFAPYSDDYLKYIIAIHRQSGNIKACHKVAFEYCEMIEPHMITLNNHILEIPFNAQPDMNSEEIASLFFDFEVIDKLNDDWQDSDIDYYKGLRESFAKFFNTDEDEVVDLLVEMDDDEREKALKSYCSTLDVDAKANLINELFFHSNHIVYGKTKAYDLLDDEFKIEDGGGYGDTEEEVFPY